MTWADSKISYERIGGVFLSFSIISSLALGLFVHHAFYLVQVGIACNLIQSSITEKCLIKSALIKVGFLGEKDLGRNEVLSSLKLNGELDD